MDSNYCECCGGVMMYRSTNNVTGKSKWKCRDCGHVMLNDYQPRTWKDIPTPEPNYYTCKDGKYCVSKVMGDERSYFGTFADEETAKLVVKRMKAVGWDMSKRPGIFKELGIHRVKCSWVRA